MKRPGPSVSNTTQILIGLVLGIAVGYLFPSSDTNGVHVAGFAEQIKPLADVTRDFAGIYLPALITLALAFRRPV